MTRADRTVEVIALALEQSTRRRFVEEWQADLASAQVLGLSPSQIVIAAARVAAFLLSRRALARLRRQPGHGELIAAGVVLGLVLTIVDAPLNEFVPFVLLALAGRVWRAARSWIDGGS